jgi:hypothetical protein
MKNPLDNPITVMFFEISDKGPDKVMELAGGTLPIVITPPEEWALITVTAPPKDPRLESPLLLKTPTVIGADWALNPEGIKSAKERNKATGKRRLEIKQYFLLRNKVDQTEIMDKPYRDIGRPSRR